LIKEIFLILLNHSTSSFVGLNEATMIKLLASSCKEFSSTFYSDLEKEYIIVGNDQRLMYFNIVTED